MNTRDIQQAYIDDYSDWQFDYFVTLHADRMLSEKSFKQLMTTFMRRLNNKVYGKRSKKKLNCFAVAERSADDLVHGHFLLGGPLGRMIPLQFKIAVGLTWASQRFGVHPRLVKTGIDEWFKPVWDAEGVLGYVTKTFPWSEEAIVLDVCNKSWPIA